MCVYLSLFLSLSLSLSHSRALSLYLPISLFISPSLHTHLSLSLTHIFNPLHTTQIDCSLREHIFADGNVPSHTFAKGWSSLPYLTPRLSSSFRSLSSSKGTSSEEKNEREREKERERENPFKSVMEEHLFSAFSSYSDVFFSCRSLKTRNAAIEAYALHALNHVLQTRQTVLKHNEKVKASEEKERDVEVDVRDQGYTRAKVLILLPFRNSAKAVVNKILELVGGVVACGEGLSLSLSLSLFLSLLSFFLSLSLSLSLLSFFLSPSLSHSVTYLSLLHVTSLRISLSPTTAPGKKPPAGPQQKTV